MNIDPRNPKCFTSGLMNSVTRIRYTHEINQTYTQHIIQILQLISTRNDVKGQVHLNVSTALGRMGCGIRCFHSNALKYVQWINNNVLIFDIISGDHNNAVFVDGCLCYTQCENIWLFSALSRQLLPIINFPF